MSADNNDIVVAEFSGMGNTDNSSMKFISDKKLAYYKRIEKAGQAMAAANREFFNAVNDRPGELPAGK